MLCEVNKMPAFHPNTGNFWDIQRDPLNNPALYDDAT